MKRHCISIHGDSPHPKIGQMNHLLEVCIALDDYRSIVSYLAQPPAPGQVRLTEFHLFVAVTSISSTFAEWKRRPVEIHTVELHTRDLPFPGL